MTSAMNGSGGQLAIARLLDVARSLTQLPALQRSRNAELDGIGRSGRSLIGVLDDVRKTLDLLRVYGLNVQVVAADTGGFTDFANQMTNKIEHSDSHVAALGEALKAIERRAARRAPGRAEPGCRIRQGAADGARAADPRGGGVARLSGGPGGPGGPDRHGGPHRARSCRRGDRRVAGRRYRPPAAGASRRRRAPGQRIAGGRGRAAGAAAHGHAAGGADHRQRPTSSRARRTGWSAACAASCPRRSSCWT